MTDYKCWQEDCADFSEVMPAKTIEDAAADFARKHIPSSEWPDGWPDNPEYPLMVVVENHGTYKVWPKTGVVPKSALKEEHQDKYDLITAVWFYAARDEPITVKERIPSD